MNRLERQIYRATCEFLTLGAIPNCCWLHRTNGKSRNFTEVESINSRGMRAVGVPKLILICEGRTYALELMPEGTQLTSEQKNCQELMREAGAIVETAYGIDQVIDQLVAWRLLRGDVKADIMARTIYSLELSTLAATALKNANILTIGELIARTDVELLALPRFGPKSLVAIRKQLCELGLGLPLSRR
jgi:hypothetical protein